MTLQELLTGSLQQLDRPTDAQTREAWRDKLTRYLNDAMIDLVCVLKPRRTDPVTIENGAVDLTLLPRECAKVIALYCNGQRVPFYYGAGTQQLKTPTAKDGAVEVCYRYLPVEMKTDTDEPDLPLWCHGALISYAVGRERASGDSASMAAARASFELYNAAKRNLKEHMGQQDAYTIENIY